jgi:glycosyltransferase involved in cell wall biosynthesis
MQNESSRLFRLKKIFWQLNQLPDLFDAKLSGIHAKLDRLENSTNRIARLSSPTKSSVELEFKELDERCEFLQLQLKNNQQANSTSTRWLFEQCAKLPAPVPSRSPLVSVIMPTWNRKEIIERAMQSILEQHYTNWECLIVDDGSTDGTEQHIESWLRDPRFRYFYQPHQDTNVARNRGLKEAQGEIITYLDTDNLFTPGWLSHVVAAFMANEKIQSVYGAQLVEEGNGQTCFLRHEEFDFDKLCRGNFIDINVFAHRRRLTERYGNFDEKLDLLEDWDIILRYTEHDPIQRIDAVGGIYFHGSPDQMTNTRNAYYNWYLIEQKRKPPTRPPLKALYALWHYPQLSESYVRSEIAGVRRLGIEVEVWSEENVAAPFESEVPVHRGNLSDVIAQFKPDLVHTHWIDMGIKYGPLLKDSGLPLTVRGHGFEFSTELTAKLDSDPAVKGIYLFPHFAAQCDSGKVKSLAAVFNPELYFPKKEKDRRLVVRTGTALPTKDLITFFKTAQLCLTHRFVLAVAQAYKAEAYLDEVIAMNQSLGNPVEILINVQHEELSEIMRNAGIYMHTAGVDQPFGMPISICESMATGCYVLARKFPASAAYLGNAGDLYETAEGAALYIQKTLQWSDDDWTKAAIRSIDQAYKNHVNVRTLRPMVDDWHRIVCTKKNSLL